MRTGRHLSRALRIGPWTVAAIEERALAVHAAANRVAGHGHKTPLAILIAGPGGISARALDGAPLSEDAVDAVLPGALETFAAIAADPEPQDRTKEEEDSR
jgi:hypothetical protein